MWGNFTVKHEMYSKVTNSNFTEVCLNMSLLSNKYLSGRFGQFF